MTLGVIILAIMLTDKFLDEGTKTKEVIQTIGGILMAIFFVMAIILFLLMIWL